MAREKLPTLLIIEDNAAIRAAVAAEANACGRFGAVLAAADGAHALDLLAPALDDTTDALPDIVLTDLYMPRVNGVEFVRRLRTYPTGRAVACAMFSSYDSPVERDAAHAAGCVRFFPKPNSLRALEELLAEVAGLPAATTTAGVPAPTVTSKVALSGS